VGTVGEQIPFDCERSDRGYQYSQGKNGAKADLAANGNRPRDGWIQLRGRGDHEVRKSGVERNEFRSQPAARFASRQMGRKPAHGLGP
jgi:hypothetical protein